MKKNTLIIACWLLGSVCASAQNPSFATMYLSLDSCRSLATVSNKCVAAAKEEIAAASWEHKAALSNFYPRLSATEHTYEQASKYLYCQTSRKPRSIAEKCSAAWVASLLTLSALTLVT